MTKNKGIWIINGILIGLLVLILLFVFIGGWTAEISLKGDTEMTLEYGDQFPDPGAEADSSGSRRNSLCSQ